MKLLVLIMYGRWKLHALSSVQSISNCLNNAFPQVYVNASKIFISPSHAALQHLIGIQFIVHELLQVWYFAFVVSSCKVSWLPSNYCQDPFRKIDN